MTPPTRPPAPAAGTDRPAPRYVENAALARMIGEYRDTGRCPEDLGAALLQIAAGIWDRYHFGTDRDDYVSACCLHLLGRPLAKVDPAGNPFSFLTTCAIRFGYKHRGKEQADRRKAATYRADYFEAARAHGLV